MTLINGLFRIAAKELLEMAASVSGGSMRALDEYETYDLAATVKSRLQHLTGDYCYLVEMSNHVWRVVRFDASGKEVEWA